MSKGVKIYAEYRGKRYWLKPLGENDVPCTKCALRNEKCENVNRRTAPCDAICKAVIRIYGEFRIVEAKGVGK